LLVNIVNFSKDELKVAVEEIGEKTFRAQQIWSWIYNHGVKDFDRMSNISIETRKKLASKFKIERLQASTTQKSADGTIKWLLKLEDGHEIETVYIPEEDRGTLCISSQVGCILNCRFCHTGTQRLVRNLTAGEIVQQVLLARDHLNEWPSTQEKRLISNIVLMGMGEPLYNYDNVSKALKIIMDDDGIAISRRKITLSTTGIIPYIKLCAKDLRVNLALSLHAATNDLRTQLVPINKKYPLEELMPVCRAYQDESSSRRITFEYVMLKNVNDSLQDAKNLVELIKGIDCIVNLIPFNPWPGAPYECSDDEQIKIFANYINKSGHYAPIRTPRGQDILAACGQLKSASIKMRLQKQEELVE